jgi:hypothetical protein
MPNPPTGLDADLLAEFAATARHGYADLLAALARVTHPADGPPGASADPVLAAGRLAECWRTACAMSAPAYSSVPVERAESVGALVHSLASAAQAITAASSGSDSTFQPG